MDSKWVVDANRRTYPIPAAVNVRAIQVGAPRSICEARAGRNAGATKVIGAYPPPLNRLVQISLTTSNY